MALTFELIYEVWRKEKSSSELQKLQEEFIPELARYLVEKEEALKQAKVNDPFGQAGKLASQISNAKRLSKEIFSRRARKIAEMALNKSMEAIVSTANLLPFEAELFDQLCSALKEHFSKVEKSLKNSDKEQKLEKIEEPKESGLKRVKFVCEVPAFVGSELEEYGPFSEGSIAELPKQVAELLIESGKAVEDKA